MKHLSSGFTLGILGGGQLGRMSAIAAAKLGISVIIYCPEENAPATKVVKDSIIAAYDDQTALKQFSDKTDIISYEFENIPVETIEYLESLKPNSVLPDKNLLKVSQDRIEEKKFLNDLGIETAQWTAVQTKEDIQTASQTLSSDEFILKTARFGYDGKGQIKFNTENIDNIDTFLHDVGNVPLILESCVDFTAEISVIIARDKDGKTVAYGPMLNEHKNHILDKTYFPANISETAKNKAIDIALQIGNAINLRGVLTVEFFLCDDNKILVNEIAPRTHNSGHWTIDACAVSQFENHVRTVCGLSVGSPEPHSDAHMLNLIGNDIHTIEPYFDDPTASIHLYSKKEARKGRKMGHITFLKPKGD